MHKFLTDFYGHYLDVLVLGYIRPELDYTSRGEDHLEFDLIPKAS